MAVKLKANKAPAAKPSAAKLKIAAQKTAKAKVLAKTPAAPKPSKVITLKTKNQISALVNPSQAEREYKLAVMKETETANDLVMKDWGSRLKTTKVTMGKLNKKYEEYLVGLLRDAYGVYSEVVKTDLADEFFSAVWNELRKEGIKVQSNTPNATLVIRYICGATISTKTISQYAKVLEGCLLYTSPSPRDS